MVRSIAGQSLSVGIHSLSFTPTTNFCVWVAGITVYSTKVDSITIESSGDMTIATRADRPTYPMSGLTSQQTLSLSIATEESRS